MTSSSRPDLPAGAVAGPLSIRDLTALLQRLPASERAALAWAPAALEQEIGPLLHGPLTSEVVAACSGGVLRVLIQTLPSLAKQIGRERFLVEVDDADAGARNRLLTLLPDAGSKRSAEWVFRALRGFARLIAQVPGEQLAGFEIPDPGDADLANEFQDDDAGILRGLVLLMAAMIIADRGGDPDRAAELCDLAFLEASHAMDRLVANGLVIAPGPPAPAGERGRALLDMVEEARAALAPEDTDLLSRARLHDLR